MELLISSIIDHQSELYSNFETLHQTNLIFYSRILSRYFDTVNKLENKNKDIISSLEIEHKCNIDKLINQHEKEIADKHTVAMKLAIISDYDKRLNESNIKLEVAERKIKNLNLTIDKLLSKANCSNNVEPCVNESTDVFSVNGITEDNNKSVSKTNNESNEIREETDRVTESSVSKTNNESNEIREETDRVTESSISKINNDSDEIKEEPKIELNSSKKTVTKIKSGGTVYYTCNDIVYSDLKLTNVIGEKKGKKIIINNNLNT